MAFTKEQQLNWLAQLEEEIIDPAREIIDPHHHLRTSKHVTEETEMPQYILEDLWQDTESGHNIVKTLFMECRSEYLAEGPENLKVVNVFPRITPPASRNAFTEAESKFV